jgi:hypothetical protein
METLKIYGEGGREGGREGWVGWKIYVYEK